MESGSAAPLRSLWPMWLHSAKSSSDSPLGWIRKRLWCWDSAAKKKSIPLSHLSQIPVKIPKSIQIPVYISDYFSLYPVYPVIQIFQIQWKRITTTQTPFTPFTGSQISQVSPAVCLECAWSGPPLSRACELAGGLRGPSGDTSGVAEAAKILCKNDQKSPSWINEN